MERLQNRSGVKSETIGASTHPLSVSEQEPPSVTNRIEGIALDSIGQNREVIVETRRATFLNRHAIEEIEQLLKEHYRVQSQRLTLPSQEMVSFEKIYTELALLDCHKHDEVTLDQLFVSGRRVLLEGPEGSGKSTLAQKIVLDHAKGLLFQDCFKSIYCIPVGQLIPHILPEKQLAEIDPNLFVARALATIVLGRPELTDIFLCQLKEHREQILLVFDGLEQAATWQISALQKILFHSDFHLLLTARPGLFDCVEREKLPFDRKVTIRGFSEPCIKWFSECFFTRVQNTLVEQDRLKSFLLHLKSHPELSPLLRVPLHLHMLCSLWEQELDIETLRESRTALYGNLLRHFIQKPRVNKNNLNSLSDEDKKNLFLALGQLALQSLNKGGEIPFSDIRALCLEKNLTFQELTDSGLLRFRDQETYFIRQPFSEYLTAFYLKETTRDNLNSFVAENRNKPHCQLVILFLAGLLHQSDLTPTKSMTSSFFYALCFGIKEPYTHVFRKLLFDCLNECPDFLGYDHPRILQSSVEILASMPIQEGGMPFHINQTLSLSVWLDQEGLLHALQWVIDKFEKAKIREVREEQQKAYDQNWFPFLHAAKQGYVKRLQQLYRQQPPLLHQTNKGGFNAMHEAARGGQIAVMEWLHQVDPLLLQGESKNGLTPLHTAVLEGQRETTDWLIWQDSALVGKVTQSGETALHFALRKGYTKIVDLLCQRAPQLLEITDQQGQNPLHIAVEKGDVGLMAKFYSLKPASIQMLTKEGFTALDIALEKGRWDAVLWLGERDPLNLEKANKLGKSPLSLALQQGRWDVICRLCQIVPSLLKGTTKDGNTLLHLAVKQSELEVIQQLHSLDSSLICALTPEGRTGMHEAAAQGNIPLLDWLHAQSSTLLHMVDNKGKTPLDIALHKNNWETVLWMCAKDPQLLNRRHSHGRTSFETALADNQWHAVLEMCRLDGSLIDRIDERDGSNLMHLAAKKGDAAIMQQLYELEPTLIREVTQEGKSVMHLVAMRGDVASLNWLYEKNSSLLQAVDNSGRTVMHVAAARKDAKQVAILSWLYEKDRELLIQVDEEGWTPLHKAVVADRLEAIAWCVDKNPSLAEVKTKAGNTPMQLAEQHHKQNVIHFFETLKAAPVIEYFS